MKHPDIKHTISVIGGDKRQTVVASLFAEDGHIVKTFGLSQKEKSKADVCDTLSDCLSGSDIIILPLPVSKDGVHLISPEYSGSISLYDILNIGRGCDSFPCNTDTASEHSKKHLLGGMLPKSFVDSALSLGFEVTDYYSSEELQQKNAVPSAEGAVMTAMQALEITLKGCRAAISGYGRIAKRLATILLGFGAEVTVLARSEASLSEAKALGCSVCRLRNGGFESSAEETAKALDGQEILFNTVPEVIFGRDILSKLKSKPLIIELASSPGGVDTEYVRDMGLCVIYAPSLPGRYAPTSAGGYIYSSISEILESKGVRL